MLLYFQVLCVSQSEIETSPPPCLRSHCSESCSDVNECSSCRYADFLRQTRAAIICQKQCRMVRERREFLRVRRAVVTIQAYAKGMFTRRIYQEVQPPSLLGVSSDKTAVLKKKKQINKHRDRNLHKIKTASLNTESNFTEVFMKP